MQKGNLDSANSDVHGKIKKKQSSFKVSLSHGRNLWFDVGARWSNDLKEYAGTESSRLPPHVALVLQKRRHDVVAARA
jgi:hypothetical protein